MLRPIRRAVLLAFATVVTGAVGLLQPTSALAQAVDVGSFTLTGDPGDYISLGEDWSYNTSSGDGLSVSASDDHRTISVSIDGHQGDWWYLDLAAPAGQALTATSYPNAVRYPFNGTGAGLDISGQGRGCNQLTGSFTIDDVVFGPHGYVQTLHASYEQHCEGSAPAARGTVTIDNPPAPAELALDVTTAPTGTFSRLNGGATVHGTTSCSTDVPVRITGTVTQVKLKTIIKGSISTSVDCVAGTDVAWAATAPASGETPFQRGRVEVDITASATDPAYQQPVSKSETGSVTLARS
jgi:hypothetical protein